ncbi:hypothetical protein Vadar_030145 [Vaccinium darrowii]|uniref:Uncharacterized protein n=1 Tax=Vaccinium darrowii TaxID=229202 RepID=A0ACB7Y3C0_9ERIC|nr:hypothetical protein Vadar_030145 [Vaccinium darrowii]
MEKLGKAFESLSEERRVLLHSDDLAQSERREVLVKINGQDSPMGQRRSNADDEALQMKTGIDQDDPFLEDDLPQEYQKMKFSPSSVVQFVSLVFILAALAFNLGFPKFMNKRLFELEMWKWESMVLFLISGHLVSGWAIRVVLFFIERNLLLRKRVLYFVYGVRNAMQRCIWLGLVLIFWYFMFGKKAEKTSDGETIMPLFARIWLCLLSGTLIWVLKTLVVKALASSFHVSKFFDWIQESVFNQYVIEALSGPSGARLEKLGEGISIENFHRLNQKNVSAWNMKRLMSIVRKGVLSTLNVQREYPTLITNERQAQAAAKNIFLNVAKPLAKCIYLEDLMLFLREDEALKTMSLLQGANEGKGISKRALKNFMVSAFKERRALSLSLNDTKSAVNKIHRLLNIAVSILILVIWLLILKITTTHFLIFLGTELLLVGLFGKTLKTTFEAIIFLFVKHPFDVGDRCEVDGVQMVVEEMNILTTVFLRHDNLKIIYPNCLLATKPISNYYRSPDMRDAVDFCIHIATPMEKIAMMKENITRYVEKRSDLWHPSPMIVLRDVEDMNRLKFSVWLSHRMNHQDMFERWARRSVLLEEMIKILRELDIEYRMLAIDVNVRNMQAISTVTNNQCVNACVCQVVN